MTLFKKSKMRHVLAMLLVFAVILSVFPVSVPVSAVSNLPRNIAIGYWENWGTIPLRDVDPRWDVVNISFAITDSSNRVAILSWMRFPDAEFMADIKFCQARGQKIVLSLGGETGHVVLNSLADRDIYYNSLVALIDKYGFDGVDVDFEGQTLRDMKPTDTLAGGTAMTNHIADILHRLKTKYGPNFMITMAPEHPYVQEGSLNGWATGGYRGTYLPLIDKCRDIITFIHPQYYNNPINYPAIGAHGYNANSYYRLSKMLITGFQTTDPVGSYFAGLRPDQVAFGVPCASSAAGSGFSSINDYSQALDMLIQEYPTFRGAMTWSLNIDAGQNYAFLNAMKNVIAKYNTGVAIPNITGQPTDRTVTIGGTAALSVTANVPSGTLSYQWFQNTSKTNTGGTAISGATSATYNAPTSAAGTRHYYCVVTNTVGNQTATARSNAVSVVVNAQTVNAQTPNITGQPTDRTVTIGGTAALTVTANVSQGTLSYQWYSVSSKVNTGGTAISGATGATYNAPTSTAGTRYYYCVVTNTDNSAIGNKTAAAASNAVSVTVNNQTLPPPWVQPFGGHDAYPMGAEVLYNGQVWVSNINGNVWAPGVYGWSLK